MNSPNNFPEPTSQFKSKSGMKRIVAAFGYSIAGFRTAWRNEYAFRQELLLAVPGAVVALMLPVATVEKLLLVAVLMLVLIVELLNSAIEAAVDRISLDSHPLAKNAKDIGSAAVFLALALAAITWLVVLLPLILRLL
jgi:diacylglycerol kinase (ATP)